MALVKRGEELRAIHRLLGKPLFLETIELDHCYRIQADDQGGHVEHGWLTVAFGSNGDAAVVLDRSGMGIRFPGAGGGDHPHVYNALKIMAEAIRLDSHEGVQGGKKRSRDLKVVHELLDCLPWLQTLTEETYRVQSENVEVGSLEGWLAVHFTRMNDSYLLIDHEKGARFHHFSGGGHKLRVVDALKILAEAIRLDEETLGKPRITHND